MSLRHSTSITVAILAAGALACSSSDTCFPPPADLPIAYFPPLQVGVSDSVTGAPIADSAAGTMVGWWDADSLRHLGYPPDSILWGELGPGIYKVTVLHPGYVAWVREGVVIKAGSCGVPEYVHLTARLRPAP